jgi:hypothetical protein
VQIRVSIGGWEHACCGDAYAIGDPVTWDVFLPGKVGLPGGAHYLESHHDVLTEGESVTGRVVDIQAENAQGRFVSILRLPSGRALRGFDDHESGDCVETATGRVLDNDPTQFTVTIDVPDDTALPNRRARST